MRHLTPEQIGLDYEALLDLIGKEAVQQWLRRHAKEILDRIGEEDVRRWLQRRHQQAATQEPATRPPETATPPE